MSIGKNLMLIKTFRKVLLNKTQAVELLNNFFEFENEIKEENIV